MDLSSYLVNASMAMSSARTQQSHQMAVMGKALDTQAEQGKALTDMLRQPVSFGHILDVRG
jgi:hypothetical protein